MTNLYELDPCMILMALHYKAMKYTFSEANDIKTLIRAAGGEHMRDFLKHATNENYIEMVKNTYRGEATAVKSPSLKRIILDSSDDEEEETATMHRTNPNKTKTVE